MISQNFDPLDGNNFIHLSQNFLIFFEQLGVNYILLNEPSINCSNSITDSRNIVVVDDVVKKKFKKDNRTVKENLLNHMTKHLFDLFVTYKSAIEIWDNLKKIVMIQEKKFMLSVSGLNF